MKSKITIFTISVLNNDYLKSPVVRACIKSWDGLIDIFKSFGYETEIKIFDYNSELVSFYRNKFKNKINEEEGLKYIPIISDFIRLDILSKNNYYLYLDGDVYFDKESFLKYEYLIKDIDTPYIGNYFGTLWSGTNTSFFKDLLELENKYNTNLLLVDTEILEKFSEEKLKRNSRLNFFFKKFFYHFGGLDHFKMIVYQMDNRVNTTIEYLNKWKIGKWRTIPIFTKKQFIINNKTCINDSVYCLDSFPFSEMSETTINDIISNFKVIIITNKKFLKLRLFLIKLLYKELNLA